MTHSTLAVSDHFWPYLVNFGAHTSVYIAHFLGLEGSKSEKNEPFWGFMQFLWAHYGVYDQLWIIRTLELVSDHFPLKPTRLYRIMGR